MLFWKGTKPWHRTEAVHRNLVPKFNLGPESLANLRMLEKKGRYSGRKVRLIMVFDPTLVSYPEVSNLKYHDSQETGDRKALRFEGHNEMNGSIYMADRRPAAADGLTQDYL